MNCKFCGSELSDDALFCRVCGKSIDEDADEEYYSEELQQASVGGKYCKKDTPKKRRLPFAAILIVLAVVILGVVAAALFGSDSSTEKDIATVQNGYLGEFTSLTVREILDNSCGLLYNHSEWDGGTTDDDKRVVQVRYYSDDHAMEDTTIQFTMLDDERFKITALVDPFNPIEKSTDLFAILNEYYYLAYLQCNRDEFTNELVMIAFLDDLNGILSSEVEYGASANYSGNRAKLCELDGQEALNVSVTMLLDNWGTIDLADFFPGGESDEGSTPQTDPENFNLDDIEFVPYFADELLMDLEQNALRAQKKYRDQYLLLTGKLDYVSGDGADFLLNGISDFYWDTIDCQITDPEQLDMIVHANEGDILTLQCKITDTDGFCADVIQICSVEPNVVETSEATEPPVRQEALTGTVRKSAGEINRRSGPGTSYPSLGRISGGAAVTIYEQQIVDGTYWGRTDNGWVCMDYIVFGVDNSLPYVETPQSQAVQTGTVRESAGEINLRSGPGTSYPSLGRISGGKVITIYEQQNVDGTYWGRTDNGWVCMDYVYIGDDSSSEEDNASKFIGNWQDNYSHRCCMSVQTGEYGVYRIEIKWGNSASSTSQWLAAGYYDEASDCIQYHDCAHWTSESDGNGNFTDYTYYTDGQGRLYLSNGYLYWQDYKEDSGSGCYFSRVP